MTRDEINAATQAFLAKGGRIKRYAKSRRAYTEPEITDRVDSNSKLCKDTTPKKVNLNPMHPTERHRAENRWRSTGEGYNGPSTSEGVLSSR